MNAVAESRRKERGPRVSTRFRLGVKNDETDARGIRRSSLLSRETKFPGANGESKE